MPFGNGTGPLGFGPGYWGGYGPGRGFGRRGYYPYSWRCGRYPWLPRLWWANPNYSQDYPYSTQPTPQYPYSTQPTPQEEKEMLEENLKDLKEGMKTIEERIKALEKEEKK